MRFCEHVSTNQVLLGFAVCGIVWLALALMRMIKMYNECLDDSVDVSRALASAHDRLEELEGRS